MGIDKKFWQGKRVFLTGHTGFKGSWLSLWLQQLDAHVVGYALNPPTVPSLFNIANVAADMTSIIADIRDYNHLLQVMEDSQPEIVIHMAAETLVRNSYSFPQETYAINVMGCVNILEAVRKIKSVRVVINVTSDKCYENKEWFWGYREIDPMGGYDPYSSSKACAELVTAAYRNSYFNPEDYRSHGVAIATVRAGNVIGGGDWAKERLIPDMMRAIEAGHSVKIRHPNAVRPWQHVLDPLTGYLMLAQKLYISGVEFGGAWNFGPDDTQSVKWIVEQLTLLWGNSLTWELEPQASLHEANFLKLECSKAKSLLHWMSQYSLEYSLREIVDWHKNYIAGQNMKAFTIKQIHSFLERHIRTETPWHTKSKKSSTVKFVAIKS